MSNKMNKKEMKEVKKKTKKSHCIMSINPNVDIKMDPTLEESIHRIFVWANEMGLKGSKVYGLSFYKPEVSGMDIEEWTRVICYIDDDKKTPNRFMDLD